MFIVLAVITGMIVLAILIGGALSHYSYLEQKGKDITPTVVTFIVCILLILALAASHFIISYISCKEKRVEIIPIKNIYEVEAVEGNSYVIEGYDKTIYNITTTDVSTGDDNYVIYTTYPKASGLSRFLINGPENSHTIVVKDVSLIPKTENLKQ